MVRFIRQEAEEKAAEIAVTAEEVKKRGQEKRGEGKKLAFFFSFFFPDLVSPLSDLEMLFLFLPFPPPPPGIQHREADAARCRKGARRARV